VARLRAVNPGEQAKSTKIKSVSEAAAGGDRRELLVAMRSRLATALDDPNAALRDLAALSRRLTEVVREIEAIDARVEEERRAAGGKPTGDETWSAV
jgi:hypothetical protein